jgi:hypothetical protein
MNIRGFYSHSQSLVERVTIEMIEDKERRFHKNIIDNDKFIYTIDFSRNELNK